MKDRYNSFTLNENIVLLCREVYFGVLLNKQIHITIIHKTVTVLIQYSISQGNM